jgi:hypothetical protein
MDSQKPFSIRQGINQEPQASVEDAPDKLRYFIWKVLQGNFGSVTAAAEVVEDFQQNPGFSAHFYNPHDPNGWPNLYQAIMAFEWWQIYDFIEFLYKTPGFGKREFTIELNELLSSLNSCYRLDSAGKIFYQGSESFHSVVAGAKLVLKETGRNTAKTEMHNALDDLSRRPQPDLTGAVQHAMAALECVANDVCGTTGETLGQLVKKRPKMFPQPIGDAVSKLYGFASDRGRHLTEGKDPDLKEVELVVGIAATLVTYLIR